MEQPLNCRVRGSALALLVLAGSVGCARDEALQAYDLTTVTTSRSTLSNYSAVLELAKTRCERASACNVLGDGPQYADQTACVEAYQDVGNVSLNANTCPDGIDRARLEECFGALRRERCTTTFEPVTSTPGCGRSLCARLDPALR
jgi:hypothetical protein